MSKSLKIKRPKQIYPLVEVIWEDIGEHEGGWISKADIIKPILMLSIGFLVADTDEHIVIAMDLCSDGTTNQRAQLPKGVIKKLKILRKAYVEKQRKKTIQPIQN